MTEQEVKDRAFTESGQVIQVSYKGKHGGYVHAIYLNDHPPIAGGRELWGFPKNRRSRLNPACG